MEATELPTQVPSGDTVRSVSDSASRSLFSILSFCRGLRTGHSRPMPGSCLGSQYSPWAQRPRRSAAWSHGPSDPSLPLTRSPTPCHAGATPCQPVDLQLPAAPWSLARHLLYSETSKWWLWPSPGLWLVCLRKVPAASVRHSLPTAAFALCQVAEQTPTKPNVVFNIWPFTKKSAHLCPR